MLLETLQNLIADSAANRVVRLGPCSGSAPDPWSVDVHFKLGGVGYRLRSLAAGDETALTIFGEGLGSAAKELFCPYPWSEPAALTAAFRHAIEQSVARVDASYILEANGAPIGHFFLWKAGGNPASQAAGVAMPELGVAIADAFAGRGLGSLAVRFLVEVARAVGADAVELTTAVDNEAGWRVYSRCGFTYTGMVMNPLDVDVTAVDAGEIAATRYRTERQMVHILRPESEPAVHAYLAAKRATAG